VNPATAHNTFDVAMGPASGVDADHAAALHANPGDFGLLMDLPRRADRRRAHIPRPPRRGAQWRPVHETGRRESAYGRRRSCRADGIPRLTEARIDGFGTHTVVPCLTSARQRMVPHRRIRVRERVVTARR